MGVNGVDTRGFPFDLVLAHIQAATCTPPDLTLHVIRRKEEFGGPLILPGDEKWEGDADFVREEKNLESEVEHWRIEEEKRAAAMEVRWPLAGNISSLLPGTYERPRKTKMARKGVPQGTLIECPTTN